MKRVSKTDYYLGIAKEVASRSTCIRRWFGAVIVNNDTIISTGYNGSPIGRKNCCDLGTCFREIHNIPHGEQYEKCRSVHAEQNAIINAAKDQMKDATLYLVGIDPLCGDVVKSGDSCSICKRMIINAGIKKVIIATGNPDKDGSFDPNEIVVKNVKNDWVNNDDSLKIHEGY